MKNQTPRTPENDKLFQAALDKYNQRYNNDAYKAAVRGKSAEFGCKLQDHALFLCGSPYDQPLDWVSDVEQSFLDCFKGA